MKICFGITILLLVTESHFKLICKINTCTWVSSYNNLLIIEELSLYSKVSPWSDFITVYLVKVKYKSAMIIEYSSL
jgi:hypothetical protein